MADCKDNKITRRFEVRDDVLEFIVIIKSGQPNINIRNNVRR